MRPVPFGLDDVTRLAAATAAPLVPLLLTIFSPEELLMRIIKVLFRGKRVCGNDQSARPEGHCACSPA